MKQIILIFCLFFQSTAFADIAILVHGYLGDSNSWQKQGITYNMEQHGWQHRLNTDKTYLLINLPSEAPLNVQSQYLINAIQQIRQTAKEERIVLVGHSAGGVVSRLAMVKQPDLNIHALVTIASPHLGTNLADKALFLSKTPVAMMTPFMGAGTLNRSRHLYADLSQAKPGNLLGWLNQQPHPKAKYVSLIRSDARGRTADDIVPAYSQDLRNVNTLKKIAKSYRLNTGHELGVSDGPVIVAVLDEILQ